MTLMDTNIVFFQRSKLRFIVFKSMAIRRVNNSSEKMMFRQNLFCHGKKKSNW